jgi:hypothetical protein
MSVWLSSNLPMIDDTALTGDGQILRILNCDDVILTMLIGVVHDRREGVDFSTSRGQ